MRRRLLSGLSRDARRSACCVRACVCVLCVYVVLVCVFLCVLCVLAVFLCVGVGVAGASEPRAGLVELAVFTNKAGSLGMDNNFSHCALG